MKMFVMQHKCPKDSPLKHKGRTTDVPWMYRACTKEAPRMHVGRTTDAVWMHYRCTTNSFTCTTDRQECLTGAPQMHFENTLGAPGMPHASFTDPPRILFRCTMNAVRQSCLFIYLVNFKKKFFHSLQFLTYSFHIAQGSSLESSAFGMWSAWRYCDFLAIWRQLTFSLENGLAYSDATNHFMNTVLCVREWEARN